MALPLITLAGIALAAYYRKKLLDPLKEILKSKERRKIGVLGMKQSGKTRFLSFLRKEPYNEKETFREEYSEFVYTTKSGKSITFLEGKDIGGDELYRVLYKEIIQKNEIIFYFFDIKKYLDDLSYKRECNSRFASILNHMFPEEKENWKKTLDEKGSKKLVIFATHKDKLNLKDGEIIKKISEEIKDKWYADLYNYVYPINTTSTEELKDITNKIFE